MSISYLIECDKCGESVEKEVSKDGNVFLGIAENGFVIQTTEVFPLGWRGAENSKVYCPYCAQGKKKVDDQVFCERCKKVSVMVTGQYAEDGLEGIRRVAKMYGFEELEPTKFYCVTCAKEVKNEKTCDNSSTTPG